MSALSEQTRDKAREKVERLTRVGPGKVDASGWKPPMGMDANVQTGPRPISRRQFKRGGKVFGEVAKVNAGRAPRASGGGGWKPGTKGYEEAMAKRSVVSGRDKIVNGMTFHKNKSWTEYPDSRPSPEMTAAPSRAPRKGGGALTADSYLNRDVKAANEERDGPKHIGGMASGGKPGKAHGGSCSCAKCSGGRVGHKGGGSVTDGTQQGMRPTGGRLARKSGGRSKKAMNVNIIIAPPQAAKPPMPMPPPGMPPPPGGIGMHQGMPPPPSGVGAPPPMVPPAGGMPPPPGLMRKSGGRAYPLKDGGGGGGKGRLAKIAAYG